MQKKITRIAQLIQEKIDEAETELVQQLDHTSRDTKGFGITGKHTQLHIIPYKKYIMQSNTTQKNLHQV